MTNDPRRQKAKAEPKAFVGFTSGGSIATEYAHVHRQTDQNVRALLEHRSRYSPAQIAMLIAPMTSHDAFPNRGQWATLELEAEWANTATGTSAEEFIKRQGLGCDGHWSPDGSWRKDAAPFVQDPDAMEKLGALIAMIAGAPRGPNDALPNLLVSAGHGAIA